MVLADTVPLYPLYALLFDDVGLSGAQISALFAVWSAVAVLAEVPSGALADRFGRRTALVAAGLVQAAGYVLWLHWPTFAGFAAGFAVWALGGALVSGAFEALLYDGLAEVGATAQYARLLGWAHAGELLAGVPAAVAATALYAAGGFALVGWASVGICLAAALLATRLPEPARGGADDDRGYLATLRAGVAEVAATPAVRAALLAAALLGGFDALEEYFPLITERQGVPVAAVPLAMLPITVGGALGAVLGGRARGWGRGTLAGLLGAGMVLLAVAGSVPHPLGLAAVVLGYGGYRAVLVVVDARLQDRIAAGSRATVTSVAGLGLEVAAFGVYAAWAVGELVAVAVAGVLLAAALPRLLRSAPDAPGSPLSRPRAR